jgi:hypothetical protein
MAITRKSRMKPHSFENNPPAPCLYPVADPRGETNAWPTFNQHVQSSKPFPLNVGMPDPPEPTFCFESHTNGKLRGGKR